MNDKEIMITISAIAAILIVVGYIGTIRQETGKTEYTFIIEEDEENICREVMGNGSSIGVDNISRPEDKSDFQRILREINQSQGKEKIVPVPYTEEKSMPTEEWEAYEHLEINGTPYTKNIGIRINGDRVRCRSFKGHIEIEPVQTE